MEVVCAICFEVANEARYLLGVGHANEKVLVVSVHDEADDFDWVALLGASGSGTDKDVHELERYKGESLFGSKGDEVYASRDEESWIKHGGVIGEGGGRSLAPGALEDPIEVPRRGVSEQESMTALFLLEYVLKVIIKKRLMLGLYTREMEGVVDG